MSNIAHTLSSIPLCRSTKWYVAEVSHKKEPAVAVAVEQAGFEVFVPQFTKWVSHARNRRAVLTPLFPGYVFIAFDIHLDQWGPVKGTPGLRRLVGSKPHSPQSISTDIINELKRRFDNDFASFSTNKFQVGDKVRLNHPSLPSEIGIIETLNSNDRITLLYSFLGKDTRIRVHSKMVTAA